MTRNGISYTFYDVEYCNMCKSGSDNRKILGKRLNTSQGLSPGKTTGITVTVCKCKVCGLIYSDPLPIPANLSDHYGTPPDNYWNPDYFTVNKDYFRNEIDTIRNLLGWREGMKSLDIGAGIGKQMLALSRAGFDAYGIEPSDSFYEMAVSHMKIDPAKLNGKMIEEADYPENSFDFISFGAVLEHLYDPSAAIDKALTWLKSDGIIHVEVPSSDWLIHKLINMFYGIKFNGYVGNLSPMHIPYHLYEFSRKSFQYHGVGKYEIAHSEYYICRTYLPRYLDFILKPLMRATKTGMQLCVWLRKIPVVDADGVSKSTTQS